MSFRLARLGRRGLDEDDARDICTGVEDEPAWLLEERASLYAEVHRLRGQFASFRVRFVPGPLRP
jgi:hypothetical protein